MENCKKKSHYQFKKLIKKSYSFLNEGAVTSKDFFYFLINRPEPDFPKSIQLQIIENRILNVSANITLIF